MTTPRPSRAQLSRVQLLTGLLLLIVLAGLPALHDASAQAHRLCALCVVLPAGELPADPAVARAEPPPTRAAAPAPAAPATDAPCLSAPGRSPPAAV